MPPQLILAASNTTEIYTLAFDAEAGTLERVSAVEVGANPSWIAWHPDAEGEIVFTGVEQEKGEVAALRFGKDGKGEVIASTSSGGSGPCSVYATREELFVGNYMSGSMAAIDLPSSLSNLSSLSLSPPEQVVQFSGSGPNAERQEQSHAHQVYWIDAYKELLVPDLGADKVWRLKKKAGAWCLSGSVEYPPGGGPRHVAFHDGILYTLLELTNTVTAHKLPSLPSEPTLLSSAPTLSNPPPQPNDMLAAEILVPSPNKTYATPYVYASNRNDPSPEGDTIAIYDISSINDGNLELVAEVRTGLRHLRGMAFGGVEDRWLVAGGVKGGGVKVFERVDGGRGLREVARDEGVEAATAFLWM